MVANDPVVIGSYYDCSIDRNVTSLSLLKIPNSKQIQVKPRKSYNIRVSAVNSCGISESSQILTIKTAAIQTISCLKLEPIKNMKACLFSWRSTVLGMNFVVLLITIFKNHVKYSTIYKGKKSECMIPNETLEQHEATEYVLQVSIMVDDKLKICENEYRWKKT